MRERILQLFERHVTDHYPDLLATLREEERVEVFFTEQVASVGELIIVLTEQKQPRSVIEERCLKQLTQPLGPSRYDYLYDTLEEEFPAQFERYYEQGILETELINIVRSCHTVFEEIEFGEATIDNRYVRYAIIGAMHEYIHSASGL